jgi:CRISPR-associated exonuclease Cas4
MVFFYFALAFLLIALLLLYLSGRQRRRAGLPGGRVVYSDTRFWRTVEEPLFDPLLGLTGRPDYLVEQNGNLIPVEVKTGHTPVNPYKGHIYQLAVYCYLVEKTLGKRPPHGLIHYPQRDFAVDYTPALETDVLRLLQEIRSDLQHGEVDRSHDDPPRCHGCGFREVCDQTLE